jgi:hypothetical protein
MHRKLAWATLATLAGGLLAPVALAQSPIDIGTLPGFTASRPKDVNNRRDIVGQVARTGPDEQAALWTRTDDGYSVEALPPLPKFVGGDARAFGRRDAPVGSSYLPGTDPLVRAVLWREDPSGERVPVDLEPPAGFTDAAAFDANHHGLIVGEATNPNELINGSRVRRAVAWVLKRAGEHEAVDLGVPEGYDVSTASGVNELGEIVGTAQRIESDGAGGSFLRATVVVWHACFLRGHHSHADAIVLPSDPDLPLNLNPTINDAGFVVAQADRRVPGQPTTSRPLLWKRWHRGFVGPYELSVPEGFTDAIASDVNELGAIVGTAYLRQATPPTLAASQAVVWTWGWARRRFVASLLANPPATAFVTGTRMNERGDVVGNAPLPAPGTSGGLLWKRKSHGHWSGPSRLLQPDLEGR